MLKRLLISLPALLAGIADAADFDVQVGAYRNPDAASVEIPAGIGELRTTLTEDGLTRFLVGPYRNRAEAEEARDMLRDAGYADAFVRISRNERNETARTRSPAQARPGSAPERHAADMPSQQDLDKLASMSIEERQNVVYLDGRLHRKIGDEFVPLRD